VADWRSLFWLAHSKCSTAVSIHKNSFFDFVAMSVTGSFTSELYLVLSGIHNLLFLVKCTRQQCMYLIMQQQ